MAEEGASQRLVSLDALRGFDMFWIVGAGGIVHALRAVGDNRVVRSLSAQLTHKDWAGFSSYDLIFPLFIFIVGTSIVLSLPKALERDGRSVVIKRILRRTLALFLAGVFYNGGFAPQEGVRIMGVLQRIALCYASASLLFIAFELKGLVVLWGALLAGYWAVMTFVGAGDFTEAGNLAAAIDARLLPGSKYYGTYDPEGILSTLPAIASCLMGVFAGMLLKRADLPGYRKVRLLLGWGALSVLLGFVWGLQFPVIKKIWTSSYVLVAGGYSCILMALFYQVIDLWRFERWAEPFVWLGVNPITIYLAYSIVDFPAVARRLVGGPVAAAFGCCGELLVQTTALFLAFLLVRFLYNRKIFLRI
ncbi:MAG: heparan-alpha-glucosaminide N-acetyltransferase domain-containing protein [Elusimicrobiota bacterium]